MIYATDLDRTLIHSKRFIDTLSRDLMVCIESKDNEDMSYMTVKAKNQLEELKKIDSLKIVPTTTRSKEQYSRIEVVKDCEYAITSNGGVILHRGSNLVDWDVIIKQKLENHIFEDVLKKLEFLDKLFVKELMLIDNVFYYAKIKDINSKLLISNYIEKVLDCKLWSYTIQGSKLYVIPNLITKESALMFLKDYLNENKLITSGDGKLDLGMLLVGDKAFVPAGSEVIKIIPKESSNITILNRNLGLLGTEDLLFNVKSEIYR